jgi:FtsH-binding integral membrane protein
MANSALYERFALRGGLRGGTKTSTLSLINLLNQKKELLILIFANLIVQLGITYYTFMHTSANKIMPLQRFFIIILMFILIFVLVYPMPSWIKFILFSIFSILEGLLLSSIKTPSNGKLIQMAISAAITIFVFFFTGALALMGLGVYLTNQFGLFLFFALLFLIIFEIISMLAGTGTMMQKTFAFVALIIFSLYIVYDTHKILRRDYMGDFVTASIDYYLDIINIFLDIFTLNNN